MHVDNAAGSAAYIHNFGAKGGGSGGGGDAAVKSEQEAAGDEARVQHTRRQGGMGASARGQEAWERVRGRTCRRKREEPRQRPAGAGDRISWWREIKVGGMEAYTEGWEEGGGGEGEGGVDA
jgi:hypothetical protein